MYKYICGITMIHHFSLHLFILLVILLLLSNE